MFLDLLNFWGFYLYLFLIFEIFQFLLFFVFFKKIFQIIFRVTKVTTKQQLLEKLFFPPKGQKKASTEGQSFPPELDVSHIGGCTF